MEDVMIDLETYGISSDSVIVQVGACYFDRSTGKIGKTLRINIDAETSIAEGFTVTASTIAWWLRQSKEARLSITTKYPQRCVKWAMAQVNEFLRGAQYIWSHATFDFVLLSKHLEKLDIRPSFPYAAARDLRTLIDLAGVRPSYYSPVGIAHDALDDCRFQVKYTVDCFEILSRMKGV